jgi:O-antigen ligase
LSIFFILIVLKRSLFLKSLLALFSVILILIISIPALQDSVINYFRLERLNTREVYWKTGLEVIEDHPVFGVGTDLFQNYFHNYAPSSVYAFFESGAGIFGKPHPHNFFLFYAAENGIAGFLTSVSFFVLFFYFAVLTLRLTKKSADYFVLSVAVTGIGIGIFFRSFLEITGYLTYGYITTDLPFWLVFGILITIYQKFRNYENNHI